MAHGSLVAQSGTAGLKTSFRPCLVLSRNLGTLYCKSSCPPKRNSVMNTSWNWARQTEYINKAIEGRNEDVGTSGSDCEVRFYKVSYPTNMLLIKSFRVCNFPGDMSVYTSHILFLKQCYLHICSLPSPPKISHPENLYHSYQLSFRFLEVAVKDPSRNWRSLYRVLSTVKVHV